jgi:hypothetical protein
MSKSEVTEASDFSEGRHTVTTERYQLHVTAQCRHMCRAKCLTYQRCAVVPPSKREATSA